MAKKKKTTTKTSNTKGSSNVFTFFKNNQTQAVIGLFLLVFAIVLFLSFVSYLLNWQEDQSQLAQFDERTISVKNWMGKIGASLGEFFIYKGFGVASLYFAYLVFLTGISVLMKRGKRRLFNSWFWGVLSVIWASITFAFFSEVNPILGGTIGYEMNLYLQQFVGKTGLILVQIFFLGAFLIVRFKITPDVLMAKFKSKKKEVTQDASMQDSSDVSEEISTASQLTTTSEENGITEKTKKSPFELSLENLKPTIKKHSDVSEPTSEISLDTENTSKKEKKEDGEVVAIDVEKIKEEKHVEENLSDKLVKDFGEFDPKLELGNYKFPTLNLLRDYNETISVDQEELEANKNRIVDTLSNYKIGIAKIKATVGPTVTLYEIIPDAGIRISKIKNLEDDIALSLSALGIRIIAPIPGKGTIGIEVPNNKPTIVSMKSVISSQKFQRSEMELPIAFGKTISNETFVVDLAKMPHLLMAGATGQGKSVGLNAVLTSLLYKKHPAEVKFVLVDPKKVELTLFNKIERHYLAKLPDSEEAIITDTTKVINTLNSLCMEMDARYDLLKTAMVRNIKEYNAKFKSRKLNPENGHKYLPYIVLVIDEFADLIMTAGKEVETPIARLAQLARAIGIHLIVATQRPSVNVITGLIKANFPARVAFRVTSKIDSRTILDGTGADQLIGKGDMLFSDGKNALRLQCAFVDTPEVESITDFIGSQRAYPSAHLLPEYVGEETGSSLDIDISERDMLFRDAALVIVNAQQGSASLLQRKLKLGYNRAGRLIDQLEAAGIVGPFEGSKARQVLIPDEMALNQLLDNE